MRYSVVLEWDPEGKGYVATVPALPGCYTQGKTREVALENAKEAILGYLEGLEKAGEPFPRERKPVSLETVAVTRARRRRAKG